MEFLLRREPGRGKNCSHCNFQDFHSLSQGKKASLARIHFSHPETDGKSADVGGGGGRVGILNTGLVDKSGWMTWAKAPDNIQDL